MISYSDRNSLGSGIDSSINTESGVENLDEVNKELNETEKKLKECQGTFLGRVVSILSQTKDPLLNKIHMAFKSTFSGYLEIAKNQMILIYDIEDLKEKVKELKGRETNVK